VAAGLKRWEEAMKIAIIVAGDDATAKQAVRQLVRDAGFEPIGTGPDHQLGPWLELGLRPDRPAAEHR
jgi:predicted dinucleotide-binding enzyme